MPTHILALSPRTGRQHKRAKILLGDILKQKKHFMSIISATKETCLKLVGPWYSTQDDTCLTFEFSENLKDRFKMTISQNGKELKEIFYEVHNYPISDEKNNYTFYIKFGHLKPKEYFIKKLTKDELILQVMKGYELANEEYKYIRKSNIQFADDILKELH